VWYSKGKRAKGNTQKNYFKGIVRGSNCFGRACRLSSGADRPPGRGGLLGMKEGFKDLARGRRRAFNAALVILRE